MTSSSLTLSDAVWPVQTRAASAAKAVTLVTAGVVLLALSAQLQIPFYPVPFTMQTFVVLVLGMAYGSRLGVATTLAYLGVGASGLGVFAGGAAGMGVLTGATAGYLVGMVLAAGLVGVLAERGWDRTPGRVLGAMLLGTAVIFTIGVGWLANVIGFDAAISAGLTPFLLSEAAKIGLAVASLPLAWKVLGRG